MPLRRVVRSRDRYFPPGVDAFVDATGFAVRRTTKAGFTLSFCHRLWSSVTTAERVAEVWSLVWGETMKRKEQDKLTSLVSHASTAWIADAFPNLAEFMTSAVWDDSKERREAPTLTIWAQSGLWKCSVKDKAEGLVMWLSAETVQELMQLIELYVLEPDAPWRHDELSNPRVGKRVEKK